MRLLEPLNGLKMAQGHWLIHLIFFLYTLTFDPDTLVYRNENFSDHEKTEAGERLRRLEEEKKAEGGAIKPWDEIVKDETLIYQLLKWSHLVAFLGILSSFALKKYEHYNLAQLIQAFITPCYLMCMPVVVYFTKEHQDIWDEQIINYRRLWCDFEIDFFFAYLTSMVIYLQLAFWTKAGSFMKDEDDLLNDDDIWNDKNSEDFFRWVKKESFDMSIHITLAVCSFRIGLMPDELMKNYGPIPFKPGGILILILFL